MQEIADGVLVETAFRGVTVGAFRTDEGFVLIDAPLFPADAKRWRALLQTYADIPIRAIILLDAHRDRMLGASWFPPTLIFAHRATYDALAGLSNAYVSSIASILTSNPSDQAGLLNGKILKPEITFSGHLRLHFGATVLELCHQPGPMLGSIWVRSRHHKVLFAGDSVVVATPPYLNSPHSKEWLEALEYLRHNLPDVKIVPGRGDVTNQAATEPLYHYLRLARERMQHLYDYGRPLSETGKIVHELLALFPAPLEYELAKVQQRIRTGLQFIYNEFREQNLVISGE